MMISVSHTCGHAADHVVYGRAEQIGRQRESLKETNCPDCFHAKVLRLTANAEVETHPPISRRH